MDFIFKHLGKIMGLVFIFYLIFWGCIIYFGIKGIYYISDHGLKNVIEQIWEGENE